VRRSVRADDRERALTDRVVEQETLRRDIALASDVQRRLLPDAPPRAECADFAAISVPARRIGGDYYDFVELGDGRIGIALADVSGKGVPAALIMSVVQASLRIISSGGDVPPARLVAVINQLSTGQRPRTSTPLSSTRNSTSGAASCATSTPGTTRRISCAPAGDRPPTPRPPQIES
jgi:serine phosphatase RsbU (regulator of sigma subunit)